MKIQKVIHNKKMYMDLLLLADEQEDMVDRYLERGDMFILEDNGVKAECVVTKEGDRIYEIKNLAVRPDFQRRGYGRQLVEFVMSHYEDGSVWLVGTGDVPSTLGFYRRCGFSESHRVRHFFTDHYDHPIFEDGRQLVDMVYLKRERRPADSCRLRPIRKEDDGKIAAIIRRNLEAVHLDIPGTAYFDPELDHLSDYYGEKPEERFYLVAENEKGTIIGGIGLGRFDGFEACGEIQKLYLCDEEKGKGLGRFLVESVERCAREAGYKRLYLETHHSLETAVFLYQKLGFHAVEKPETVQHSTMDCFYVKEL